MTFAKKWHRWPLAAALALLATGGCRTQHVVKTHHTIEPIHITIDVNVRVDRALDDFFADIDSAEPAETAPETPTEEPK